MVVKRYDVIVAGGGIAGIAAAAKAARSGAKTLLIERYAFLGGMAAAGMVSPFMKYETGGMQLVCGIFSELCAAMRARGGMIDNGFSSNSFRRAACGLLEKSGSQIMLNSEIFSVCSKDGTIKSLKILSDGGIVEASAKIFRCNRRCAACFFERVSVEEGRRENRPYSGAYDFFPHGRHRCQKSSGLFHAA